MCFVVFCAGDEDKARARTRAFFSGFERELCASAAQRRGFEREEEREGRRAVRTRQQEGALKAKKGQRGERARRSSAGLGRLAGRLLAGARARARTPWPSESKTAAGGDTGRKEKEEEEVCLKIAA